MELVMRGREEHAVVPVDAHVFLIALNHISEKPLPATHISCYPAT